MELDKIRDALGSELYAQVSPRLRDLKLEILDPAEGLYVKKDEMDKLRKSEADAISRARTVTESLEEVKKKAKEDSDTYVSQLSDMEERLKAREAEVQALKDQHREKDQAMRGMQEQLTGLEKRLKESTGTIRGLEKTAYERRVVEKSGAKDPDLVMRLLDDSRVLEEKDGSYSGISEQLEEMKRGAAYLFRGEISERGGLTDVRGMHHEGDVNAAIRAAFGR